LRSDVAGPSIPASYTFLPKDGGKHGFQVPLGPGAGGVIEVDDPSGALAPGRAAIRRFGPSEVHFEFNAPATATAGKPFDVIVETREPYGELIVHPTAIQFSATDPKAVLPTDPPMTVRDNAYLKLPKGVTLSTPGRQTITVRDPAGLVQPASATVTVVAGPSAGA
jgi:hypothetical protein